MGTIQNVFFRVSWPGYRRVAKPKPAPGGSLPAAYTLVDNRFTWSPAPILNASQAKLGDIEMIITLVKVPNSVPLTTDISFSWVADYVDQTSTFADELLHHEQGHYDIAAFLYADLFSDIYDQFIRAPKPKVFQNQLELNTTMNQLKEQRRLLIEKVYKQYDDQCGNVGSAAARTAQKKWDMYFTSGRVNRFDRVLKESSIIP